MNFTNTKGVKVLDKNSWVLRIWCFFKIKTKIPNKQNPVKSLIDNIL